MFDLNDLWFRYDAKDVLKGVTLSLERGKFFTIIGPNGAGKTTLLNLLTGFLTQRKGEVQYLKTALADYSVEELARHFAIISQRSSIGFPFTCLEVVMMGRNPFTNRMKRLGEHDLAIVEEAMRRTDTLRFADLVITEVSGGEFQRVMFARALAQQPKVLFLDEAFSGMDISHRLRSLKLVRQLVTEEHVTVIAVMHDLNLAYMFSDEVIVLKEGELQGVDAPGSLMTSSFIHAVFDVHVRHVEDKGLLVVS